MITIVGMRARISAFYKYGAGEGTLNQSLFAATHPTAGRPLAMLLLSIVILLTLAVPAATPIHAAATPSWHAEFFTNSTLSGTPALVREDAAIDFDWTGT